MEKRSLGAIVVAGAIALALITTAYLATHRAPTHGTPATLSVKVPDNLGNTDLNGDGVPDWEEALVKTDTVAPPGTTSYVAPSSLPATEALARELFASYAAARQGGTLDLTEAHATIEEVVARQTVSASPPTLYNYSALRVRADASIPAYEGALALALSDANQVTEYELMTFSRVLKGSRADAARLEAAADVYAAIAERLVVLAVPPALASDHLSAVNSLSVLASAAHDLAVWNNDPLDALALVNNFVEADTAFSTELSDLVVHMRALEKKS